MLETWVRSLGREDPLEKEMTTHSSILAGESHGRRSLVGYSPQGCKESDTTERLYYYFTTAYGTLVPQPGVKPEFPELQADSLPLNHLGSEVK